VIARRSILALAGAAAFPAGLFGCGEAGLGQLAAGPKAKAIDAPNGDSLRLEGGQTVRLVGIEAPKGQGIYAAESRLALTELAVGKQVQLCFGGARQDAYGRTLAHLRLPDGAWLQKALLEAGAVRVRTYADNRALARPMLDAEARARKAARGLWTLLAYRVRLPAEAAAYPFGFQIVEGRVVAVGPGERGMALNLEKGLVGVI
jgi:endonuclease YncB( thermonuclease family)